MLEEGVSDHRPERVTMKTLVVEAKFLFQLLMGLLADPSGLDCGSQVAQVHLGWQVGKTVFLFSRQALLTDEPTSPGRCCYVRLPLSPQLRTYRCTALTDAKGRFC